MGKQWKQCQTLFFGGSKITANGDCSHEIKRRLLLERKVMINLDSIFKRRDITLPTKFHLVKAMVFPVVMYGCESWTIKKAECWRIDAFELWCWRRLLRVPWTARRSNQSILKEISPGCSLEGVMLKLKPQYFGHLMQRADSLEKTLMLGGIGGRRRRGRQRMRWLDGITDSMDMSSSELGSWWWTGRPGVLWFMGLQSRTRLSDWTEMNWMTNDVEHLSLFVFAVHMFSLAEYLFISVQFSSVAQSCLTICNPMNHSTPGLPVRHQLPEFTQTHVHWVGDAIQPSCPLSSPFPPALNLSQHQGLSNELGSLHQVAKILGLQLQHRFIQWIFRVSFL